MSYGCFNRPPFEPSIKVQDGKLNSWAPRMAGMEFRMEPTCQYTLTDLGEKDEKCHGCKWKAGAGTEVAAGPVSLGDSLAGVRQVEGESPGDPRPGDVERASAVAEQRSALEKTWPTAALYQPTEEK